MRWPLSFVCMGVLVSGCAKPQAMPITQGEMLPSCKSVTAGLGGEMPPGTKVDRSEFIAELRDPEIKSEFAGRIKSEVGGKEGERAQIAFAETIFNRATARHQSVRQTLWGKYFPTDNPSRSENPAFLNVIKTVLLEGTNITQGATGNASGTVGFSRGGRQTTEFGGERFGVESRDIGWRQTFIPTSCDLSRGLDSQ